MVTDQINEIAEQLGGDVGTLPDNLISTKLKYIISLLGGSSDSKLLSQQLDVIIELLQEDEPYTPIEYIESTGSQYINTEYFANRSTKVELKVCITDTSSCYMLGARNAFCTYDYSVGYDSGYSFIYGKSGQGTGIYSYVESQGDAIIVSTEINEDGGKVTVDGDIYSCSIFPDDYTCNYPFYIFATDDGNNPYKKASIRLYYLKIWDDGVLSFDLIPVLDENNVACLYNKVTETYLYNAGSGAFIAGDPI